MFNDTFIARNMGFIHYRINHSKEFADRQNHINGIENFWNQAKRVLRKYNGIDRKSFPLPLKEYEQRFNNSGITFSRLFIKQTIKVGFHPYYFKVTLELINFVNNTTFKTESKNG